MNKGIVIKSTGSRYLVSYEEDIVECVLRGKFKTKGFRHTNPIATGDYVGFEFQKEHNKAVIKKIYPRKNFLIRKSTNLSKQSHIIAANIDYAFLLITLKKPVTYTMFIDRYLVACEANNIVPILVFNKIDIYNSEDKKVLFVLRKIYENINYKCVEISVKENKNINEIIELIEDKTIVVSGNSGVGKTSLLNLLDSKLKLKTSEISESHEQGKHTTTFAEMHKIGRGFIIDTPGIKGFGLQNIEKEDLGEYFPEMKFLKEYCKFNNCTHTHEPECAVKTALENKKISKMRYKNYLNIFYDDDDKHRLDKYGI